MAPLPGSMSASADGGSESIGCLIFVLVQMAMTSAAADCNDGACTHVMAPLFVLVAAPMESAVEGIGGTGFDVFR